MLSRFPISAALLAAALLAIAAPLASAAPPKSKLVVKTYPVADLVVPTSVVMALPPVKTEKTSERSLECELIKLLVAAIAPQSWSELGGAGTIDYNPATMSLVVNQTPDIHEQVADLVAHLRRLQDQQIVLEIKWLTVSENICERIGIDFGSSGEQPRKIDTAEALKCLKDVAATPSKEQFLNDAQVRQLMEAVQNDERTLITQAPRITLLNGQNGSLCIDGAVAENNAHPDMNQDKQSLCIAVQPFMSADRRFVRIALKADQTEIQQSVANVQSIQKTVTVPDGGTVLLSGVKKVRDVREVRTVPMLSKIPYVNRLFTKVGYVRETHNVFMLVTPRIITAEQDEVKVAEPLVCPKCESKTKICDRCCEAEAVTACPKQAEPAHLICKGAGLRIVIGEEKEEKVAQPCPKCEQGCKMCLGCCETVVTPTLQTKVLAELLKAYDQACAEGRGAEAEKFARAALTIDPTCFRRK